MHFLFLNQYAPPDPAPTARLLGDLTKVLRADGHTVEILSQSESYHQRPARGGSRLRRELAALWAIGRVGLARRRSSTGERRRIDVVLSLSSPPGLLAVAAALALWHRAKLAHWAMDLYPELALALGEIGKGLPYRITRLAMAWAYRRCALIVALDEDMQAHLRRGYGVNSRVLPPWPAPSAVNALNAALAAEAAGTIPPVRDTTWTWLYSGNLGRAHEWQTLLDIQAQLEFRGLPIQLVFQGNGAARGATKERARELGLKAFLWQGYAAEDDLIAGLMSAHLLIVTQRPAAQGLLWPSKLALIERLPRPVLWIGPVDGAIANRLRSRGDAGVFAPGDSAEAARWIEARYHQSRQPVMPLPNEATEVSCNVLAQWLLALQS
jgi:colanic acid biosynthesis glycosyl transferase WcaI